jgi:hypothetical protein
MKCRPGISILHNFSTVAKEDGHCQVLGGEQQDLSSIVVTNIDRLF